MAAGRSIGKSKLFFAWEFARQIIFRGGGWPPVPRINQWNWHANSALMIVRSLSLPCRYRSQKNVPHTNIALSLSLQARGQSITMSLSLQASGYQCHMVAIAPSQRIVPLHSFKFRYGDGGMGLNEVYPMSKFHADPIFVIC